MRANSLPNLDRLPAVDIVRYFSFLAIAIFHMTFALWAPHGLNFVPLQNPTGQALEVYARTFAFSGFTVLFLSFFLFGFKGVSNKKFSGRLPLYIFVFALGWILTVEEFPYWWDIYPFLLVALVLLHFTKKLRALPVALVSGILLTLPFWRLEALLNIPLGLKTALVGVCQMRSDLGDWPLLPWAAFPVFAFALGQLTQTKRELLKSINRKELVVWTVLLAACLPFLGKYYVTPLGEEFGCFMFRQDPRVFWAHQIPVFAILRLGFLQSVHQRLKSHSIVNWISSRAVNRQFFIVYFAHYPLAILIAGAIKQLQFTTHPYALTIATLSLLLLLEAAAVVFDQILAHNRFKGWALWPRTNAR